jgi:hypothetical protein
MTVVVYVICTLTDGLRMGAPTSAILAEAYLQHKEHKQLYPILKKYQIIGYLRYVDDILIIYNKKKNKFRCNFG